MTVAAVIAARKNSKGVPGKNRRIVGGLPLWQWSLLAAQRAKTVERIIVTTDDEKLLSDARELRCETVWRPRELATDDAPLDAALIHAIDEVGFDGVVMTLQPTVPVRREGLLDDAVRLFLAFPAARSLLTVSPLHFVWQGDSGQLLNGPRVNRQEMRERLYHEDGSVFLCRAEDLRAHGTRVIEPVTLMETERTVDIDTLDDLALADFLLLRREVAS